MRKGLESNDVNEIRGSRTKHGFTAAELGEYVSSLNFQGFKQANTKVLEVRLGLGIT